ncbi:hypothetical protein CU098_007265 [Rhizopus stolonifer]|uniref:Uncharacterized protein n=1 Tax=Rhizopus stolonifer TaxID=4846 RepID=A0A367KST5_RHIST|nr:hypothetical protein CU098_007265 [Rhizopus stolonifer]
MFVSEAVSTAIFTITRLLYDATLGVLALILFSKLPGGSSTKFWYEQPDLVGKLTSLFQPSGPTGRQGVKSTNAVGVLCLFLALALNILPTILSKLSPIRTIEIPGETNATLSPISRLFVPTLTDISLPQMSVPSTSKLATTKFLCSYIKNGCTDAKNNTIASIIWDPVEIRPLSIFHNASDTDDGDVSSLLVSFNDTFATSTTPQQYLQLAKNTFGAQLNYTAALSFNHWLNNNLTGFYTHAQTTQDTSLTSSKYDLLHGDQFTPLNTPDLSDLLRQGRRKGEGIPTQGAIDRAERWSAIHRTATLSSVLWQSVNAHAGESGSDWQTACFFCQLIGIQNNSSYVDQEYRLSTVLCLVEANATSGGISYWCLHTFSQLWNVYHEHNPYAFFGSYDDSAWGTEQVSSQSSTPFPFFPPPTHLTTNRTYIPIVPIFEIRSKDQCDAEWDYHTQTIQAWITHCADNNMGQVSIANLSQIALNIWQLSSTITVGGFLVTAQYFTHEVGIDIGLAVQVVIGVGIVLCLFGQIILHTMISPLHRQSLYETIRVMAPSYKDPYSLQKVLFHMAPTNTLQLVDSNFDKRICYLKLDNDIIVTLPEEQASLDDTDSQNWSKRQLLGNF